MRTKQLRLSDAVQIRERMREFVGKKINIVLTDNTAMFGELTGVNDAEIKLTNMRRKEMTYRIDAIAELYLDTLA